MSSSVQLGYQLRTAPPDSRLYELFLNLPHQLHGHRSSSTPNGRMPAVYMHPQCYVLMQGHRAVGRFALYENPHMRHQGQRVALLGCYDSVSDPRVHRILLTHAILRARLLKAQWLIGPMEGNIWETYRFRTTDSSTPFLLEPTNPANYPSQWEAAGFSVVQTYQTNIDTQPRCDRPQLMRMYERYRAKGLRIRCISFHRAEEELHAIAQLCNEAFRQSFLFTPLDPARFVAKYRTLLPLLDPSWIWLAESPTGRLEAFVFALPDVLAPDHKRLIIKTIATRPDTPYRGIAVWLARWMTYTARTHGYRSILHALIRSDSPSLNASRHFAQHTYARYALYGLRLNAHRIPPLPTIVKTTAP